MFPDRTDDKFEQPGVAVIHPEINLPVSGFFPPVSDNLFSAAAVRSQVRLLEGTGPIVRSKVHRSGLVRTLPSLKQIFAPNSHN